MLRISGTQLQVDALLNTTALRPHKIWRKNEPRKKGGSRLCDTSGFSVVVSNAAFHEFETQLSDASQFVQRNSDSLRAIQHFQGVELLVLDFGVELSTQAPHSVAFSNQFLQLAAAVGLSVELTHYPE